MRREVQELSSDIIKRRKLKLAPEVRTRMLAELDSEVFGLGPLDPLMQDPEISDILVNTCRHVFVERRGVLERVPTTFQDDRHLHRVIDRIVSRIRRRVVAALWSFTIIQAAMRRRAMRTSNSRAK